MLYASPVSSPHDTLTNSVSFLYCASGLYYFSLVVGSLMPSQQPTLSAALHLHRGDELLGRDSWIAIGGRCWRRNTSSDALFATCLAFFFFFILWVREGHSLYGFDGRLGGGIGRLRRKLWAVIPLSRRGWEVGKWQGHHRSPWMMNEMKGANCNVYLFALFSRITGGVLAVLNKRTLIFKTLKGLVEC